MPAATSETVTIVFFGFNPYSLHTLITTQHVIILVKEAISRFWYSLRPRIMDAFFTSKTAQQLADTFGIFLSFELLLLLPVVVLLGFGRPPKKFVLLCRERDVFLMLTSGGGWRSLFDRIRVIWAYGCGSLGHF